MLLDSTHSDLATSLSTCIDRRAEGPTRTSSFNPSLWSAIAEVGLFDLGRRGDNTLGHLVTGCQELGRRGVYGPLAPVLLTREIIDDATAEDRLVDGTSVATLVRDDDKVIPWGDVAELILVVGDQFQLAEITGKPIPVRSMSGEPWISAPLRPTRELQADDQRAIAVAHLVVAAWVVGAATAAVDEAAEYVVGRVQFGRTLGSFQAVSHPLAMARARLIACDGAVRVAAQRLEQNPISTSPVAARLASTRRSLDACLVVHQAYGALGFISEGPLGFTALRVRELGTIAPDDRSAEQALGLSLVTSHNSKETEHVRE